MNPLTPPLSEQELGGRDFGLFELGSTSLKFYFRPSTASQVQKVKAPWEIGHEVPITGRISRESITRAVDSIRHLLARYAAGCEPVKMVAFATGVFRVAANMEEFITEVQKGTDLKVRVISGDNEAALLKSVFLARKPPLPAFAFDLGGGTLQWVAVRPRGDDHRGSIPLGVIWLYRRSLDSTGRFSSAQAGDTIRDLLGEIPTLPVDCLTATGGTIKSICKTLNRNPVRRGALQELEEVVIRDGPPPGLKPHRREIFLPGIVVARNLMERQGAQEIRYEDLSVGKAMLEKVIPFYDGSREDPHPSDIFRRVHYSAILPSPQAATDLRTWIQRKDRPDDQGAKRSEPK